MDKDSVTFHSICFLGSTLVGMMVSHQVIKLVSVRAGRRRKQLPAELKNAILVIPAQGPSYIYSASSWHENGLTTFYHN
jgi:hypothetical protein